MKLKIDRKVFAQALSEVAPFAPVKSTIAILKNAKITTKGNRMKIEANNTQSSMTKYIETLECDADGSFLVEIAELNKFIAKIKTDVIELQVSENTVSVLYPKGKAEFQSVNADEYPAFKAIDTDAVEISIPTTYLIKAVSNGRAFVSLDTLRPQMCSIYAYLENGVFGYCATDTHKLIHGHDDCVTEIKSPNGSINEVHWLIMPQAFSSILNVCKNNDMVKICITDKCVSYRIGNNVIHTIQTVGAYPPFKRVIPSTWDMECTVNKEDLSDACGRVALFCDSTLCVKMNISRIDMTLSVDNLEYMKKNIETIYHKGCDKEITMGVNVNNLSAAADVFDNGEILMRMTDPSRPILFTRQEDESVQVIAMPMTLNT